MSNIAYIMMVTSATESCGEAIRKAAKLSLEHSCNVKFNYSGQVHTFVFNRILECVETRNDKSFANK